MSNLNSTHQYAIWISNNIGTIIKVLIIFTIIVTALINPGNVFAQPVMGGSVG